MRAAVDKVGSGTVFRMWQNGEDYEILADEQAPDVYGAAAWLNVEDELIIDSILPWFTVTNGMTNQFGYHGPVMHNSEFISQDMVDDILAQYDYRTHYFVWQPVEYRCDDNCCSEYEGWVILAREVNR